MEPEMTTEEPSREHVAEELVRCRESLPYFARNYFRIARGYPEQMVPFVPRPRQETELSKICDERLQLSSWYRQAGYTTIACAFVLWKTLFSADHVSVIMSASDGTVDMDMDKVTGAYEALPAWMKPGVKELKHRLLVLENGSRVVGRRISANHRDAVCGFAPDLTFFDDFGYAPAATVDYFLKAEFPVYSSSARRRMILACMGGSCRGAGEMWKNAKEGPDVRKSEFYWYEDPRFDDMWAAGKRRDIGDTMFGIEYEGTSLK